MKKIGTTVSLAAFAALVTVSPAGALTLGDSALPSGTTMPLCTTSTTTEIVQTATNASYAYTVPSGGGAISSWSFNAAGAKAGAPYELVIARPSGSNYQIIGTDPETVPSPVPSTATFSLKNPIDVQGGDILGIAITKQGGVGCLFKGGNGSLPTTDTQGTGFTTATVGSSFGLSNTVPQELVNVSANLVQGNDVAITQKLEPASITAGGDGVFLLSVTSSGPSKTPVTLTDTLPSGLSLVSASAGTAPCTTSGQTITCSLSGAPASVAIVASAKTAGSYTNSARAQGTVTDPNSANNTASATLSVTNAGSTTTSSTVPSMIEGVVTQAGLSGAKPAFF